MDNNKKSGLLHLILSSSGLLLAILSMIINSLFISWICFVSLGLAIYSFMSHIANLIKTKEKTSLIIIIISSLALILSVIAIFIYKDCIQAFISTMI